jgi:GNAT superfamily N-acetyltransferase
MEIRPWCPATDLAPVVAASGAADQMFADAGLVLPPDDPTDLLLGARQVLVAGTPPVGFAALTEVDGHAHLAELAVRPDHGRRGIGGRLLAAACAWAVAEGYPAITLTTFADLPWNAPWYAARGFTELAAEQWGPGLREVCAAEHAAGIVVARRVIMIGPPLRNSPWWSR